VPQPPRPIRNTRRPPCSPQSVVPFIDPGAGNIGTSALRPRPLGHFAPPPLTPPHNQKAFEAIFQTRRTGHVVKGDDRCLRSCRQV